MTNRFLVHRLDNSRHTKSSNFQIVNSLEEANTLKNAWLADGAKVVNIRPIAKTPNKQEGRLINSSTVISSSGDDDLLYAFPGDVIIDQSR